RRRASAKPALETATAPAITKASVASHAPNRSRKPSTFCVSVMPETKRPMPNRRPQAKLASTIMSASDAVARDCDGRDRNDHEHRGGDQRACRQPRDAAHAVARGAAAAHAAAEPD